MIQNLLHSRGNYTARTQRWLCLYWFEADGVLWVGPIAAQAKEIPLPPCHTDAASVAGFSDSNTHDALVFTVT